VSSPASVSTGRPLASRRLALRAAECSTLIAPEIPERLRRELSVSDGMSDVAVSQVVLDRPSVVTVAGLPGAVSQHMVTTQQRGQQRGGLGPLAEFVLPCVRAETLPDMAGQSTKSTLWRVVLAKKLHMPMVCPTARSRRRITSSTVQRGGMETVQLHFSFQGNYFHGNHLETQGRRAHCSVEAGRMEIVWRPRVVTLGAGGGRRSGGLPSWKTRYGRQTRSLGNEASLDRAKP
jgi:hypothetical protein